jgi:lipoprotein-releasing system permease protein
MRRSMSLPIPDLLALRYLKSARRDAFVSFLSLLAGGGIALGVAALILVQAALSGLQNFLRADVLSRTPHMEIELPRARATSPAARDGGDGGDGGADPSDPAALAATLAAVPGVTDVRRLIRGHGWLLPPGGSAESVAVVGFDGGLPAFFEQTPEQAADSLRQGIIIGEDVLYRWGLSRGQLVELASPRPTLTPLGPRPRLLNLRIAGTFTPGHTEDREHRVAVPLDVAERLFGPDRQRLEVRATSLEAALELAPTLAALLPAGAELRTWKDLNRGLFFALQLEKRLMFLSVFLIVPVAAMALITVLALLVSAKRGEIGMLHALGCTPRQVERAFFTLGCLLAGVGISLGALVGIVGAIVLDRTRLLAPPGDVYYVLYIPFRLEAADLAAIGVTTVGFALSSAWLAARRAASLRPVEALKNP